MAEPQHHPYEVLAVRYGTRQTTRSEVFLNYHVYDEPDGPIGMDYFFWLLRDGERVILVDCGFDPEVGARRGREVLCTPTEALERLGLGVGAVDLMIVTHAHYDHIGNLRAFPDTPLLVAASELAFWSGPYGERRQFATSTEAPEIAELRAAASQGRITTFSGRTSPRPGIDVLEVGGHTPGQSVVVVDVADGGRVVLASDATHYYEEYDLDRPFAFVADLEAMYRGFDTLRELEGRAGSVLVPGHDPEVMERFAPCEALPDLAVRLA